MSISCVMVKEKDSAPKFGQYNYDLLRTKGEDIYISNNVEIKRPHLVSIGNHVAIDSGFYITCTAEIGNFVHVGPYVTVIGGQEGLLKIGNFNTIALGSKLLCGSDDFSGDWMVTTPGIPKSFVNVRHAPIVCDNFVNICANAVILPGVTLAEGTVVGACSLVTKDTEPWTVYMGIPARPVKKRNKEKILEYAHKLLK